MKKQYCAKWRNKHPEKVAENKKRWRKQNPEKVKEEKRKSRLRHLDKIKEKLKLWKQNNPEKVKVLRVKYKCKRRQFGFIPLNEFSEGSVFHHLDLNYGIYIPREIHKSIPHSVLHNYNMDEINAIAWNYLHLNAQNRG
jgi:thiamine kinase-like enzyme